MRGRIAVVAALALAGWAASGGAQTMTPPSGPDAATMPTPPVNQAPGAGQEQRIEGTVVSRSAHRLTLETPHERVLVDLSQIRGEDRGVKPGDRIAVAGVFGPEREVLRAWTVRPLAEERPGPEEQSGRD